jgi:hypothetical protein
MQGTVHSQSYTSFPVFLKIGTYVMDPYKEVRYVVPELDNVEVSCGFTSLLSVLPAIAHGINTRGLHCFVWLYKPSRH